MNETIYCQKCDIVLDKRKLKYGNCPSCGNPLFKKKIQSKVPHRKVIKPGYKSYKDYLNNAPKDSDIKLSELHHVVYDRILECYVLWEVHKNYRTDLFHGTRDKCVSHYFKKIQNPKPSKKKLSVKKD